MPALYNLIVELDDATTRAPVPPPGIEIIVSNETDERTLAWIDDSFESTWSGEARMGATVVAQRDGVPAGFATFDPQGLRFAWLRGLARERGVGIFGPFGVVPEERKTGLGVALLRRALAGLRERGYDRALIPAVGGERLVAYYADAVGARVAEQFDRASLLGPPLRTLVMASGNGSNLQALLEAASAGRLPLDVAAVVSNDAGAYALERARRAGVPSVRVVEWNREAEARAAYDARLLDTVSAHLPQLVLLLGWMHLLAEPFVRTFPELLNLHPAFLPLDPQRDDVVAPDGERIAAFRGAHAVRDALAASSPWVGATLHLVTPATDRGPVVARKPLRVVPGEDEARLMARLHPLEHRVVAAGITRRLFEYRQV